jgi:hypothetical protein
MLRITTVLLLVIIMLPTLSCSKKDIIENNEENSWVLGSNSYIAHQVLFYNTPGSYSFYVTSKPGGDTGTTLGISFFSDPGSGGQFLITDNELPNTASIKIYQYAGSSGTPTAVYYNKQTNVKLNFSKGTTGGASISFPGKIWMYKVNSQDSALFSISTLVSE